jgi:hypothetical protein
LLASSPRLAHRFTEAAQSGELEALTMNETSITLRLPTDLLDRAEALVPRLEADPELATFGRVSRAAVLRLAFLRGLAILEEQYPEGPKRKR